LLILLAIIIILSAGLSAASKTDWETYSLKGKVKTMSSEYNTYNFNNSGYIESVAYYYGEYNNGVVYYAYDSKGLLLSIDEVDSWEGSISNTAYTYDAAGLMVQVINEDMISTEISMLSYNDKKQNTWSKTYDADDALKHATEYAYDNNGNKIKEIHYDKDMNVSYTLEYVYDKNGNLIEDRNTGADNKLIRKFLYAYNSKNLRTEEITYKESTITYRCNNIYDEHGNPIEKNITEPEENKSSQQTREYQYDEHGNWLKFDVYVDGELQQSESRTISYYTE
jgi:uncharacterized protein YkuJ